MMFRSSVAAVAFLAVIGCSSSDSKPIGGQGEQGPGGTSQEVEKNSYGAAYPTQNLGIIARSGNKAGNIMKNFKFRGYPTKPGDVIPIPNELKDVKLSDYYDPELRNMNAAGEPYRVLHITVSSVWCTPCQEEAKEIVAKMAELDAKGVLFMTAIADGPIQGRGAEPLDLDGWVRKHKANYTHVLDPSLKNFGGFFDAAAVPFNADIDLRSMEILYAGTGAPPDMTEHVDKWIRWTKQNPAQGAAQ
jgi:hypothetical protein